jgi:hypothetical protein
MLSVRLKPDLATRLAQRCKREGLSKSEFVSRLLARELGNDLSPYELLMELTADLPGSGNPHNARNISQRVKEKLRAKHNR